MPTLPNKHRTYCKNCQDFKIHSHNHICETCDTEFTSYFPSEVNVEKLEQQRKRYSKQKQNDVLGLYGAFLKGDGIQAIVDLDKVKIVECDAGQKEIDEKKKIEMQLIKQKIQEVLDDYNTNYKHLNRNDKCTCGNNKKYKQCHLNYFRNLGIKI